MADSGDATRWGCAGCGLFWRTSPAGHSAGAYIAVMLEADHMCMSLRGVERAGSRTITTQFSGSFREHPEEQARFLTLVRGA